MTSVFTLPRPPSVNQLYRNVPRVGRVKTRAYKEWIRDAGWTLKAARPTPVRGRYRLRVEIGPTRADIGNLEKGLSDLLQAHGIIENDRLCQELLLERSKEVPVNAIRVTLAPFVELWGHRGQVPVDGPLLASDPVSSAVDNVEPAWEHISNPAARVLASIIKDAAE